MTSKEALKEYKEIYIDKTFKGNECPSQEWYFKIIKKDLDRLEKLEKAIEILKTKKVNIFHLYVFDTYEQYKEHYPFAEYNNKKDMLNKKEYKLLKGGI